MTLVRFEYTDAYRIDVPDLDKQHSRFFEMYNALVDRLEHGENLTTAEISSVYNDLFLYTKYHFREEEWVMKTAGYSGLREHLEQHQRFVEHLTEMRRADATLREMIKNIEDFVRCWAEHILVSDRALGDYLKQR